MTELHNRTERLAELHRLCDADYAKGQAERAARLPLPPYTAFAPAAEPTDLQVAVSVAQQLLDSDQLLSVRESLRLLLRALGAETGEGQ